MTHTYAVQHPDMSEPLMIDSEVMRTPRALAAWASMYILREYDVVLALDEFTVTEVTEATDEPQRCEWFAKCANDAVGTVKHPVLGEVPTCARCVDKLGLVLS